MSRTFTLAALLAALSLSLPAAAGTLTVEATYKGGKADHSDWYATGLTVTSGQLLAIKASGVAGAIPSVNEGPNGGSTTASGTSFLAPGLPIGSLVARIGPTGTPFKVGEAYQATASASGELYLGYNDSRCTDNHGSFSVTFDSVAFPTLYADNNYGGKSQTLPLGASTASAVGNDATSSVKVPAGFEVILYEHGPGNGKSKSLTADAASLPGFDNITSNVQVNYTGP
jgi:hypothetical protein